MIRLKSLNSFQFVANPFLSTGFCNKWFLLIKPVSHGLLAMASTSAIFPADTNLQSLDDGSERKMSGIRSFIFLDLETTGLPSEEHNKTRITELCLVAVESGHIGLGVYPRVKNKLNLCFNPQKMVSPSSSDITGLSNDILENQAPFSNETVTLIKSFVEKLRQPVCFVAHNGNRFDYPILQAEIQKCGGLLSDNVLCIDSWEAFKYLHFHKDEEVQPEEVPQAQNDTVEMEGVRPLTEDVVDHVPIELNDDYDYILLEAVEQFESTRKKFKPDFQAVNETTPFRTPRTPPRTPPGRSGGSVENSKGSTICSHVTTDTSGFESSMQNVVPKKIIRNSTSIRVVRSLNFGNDVPETVTEQLPVKFRLVDVYKRLTNKEPVNSHEAEADVDMLIHCAATLGSRFVDWANKNYKKFNSVEKMSPGKRL